MNNLFKPLRTSEQGETMTKDEALKLALSTLDEVRQETFRLLRDGQKLYAEEKVWSTIISIKEALAKEKALQALHDENERLGLYKDAYAENEPVAWISHAMTSAEKAIDVAIKLEREACAKLCDAFTAHAMTSAEKAIDVAIKLEREACANICDTFQSRDVGMQPAECAGAIRARGEA